jgi:23S rRNA pseudouridine2604 synthase
MSRREADRAVTEGRVDIDGRKAVLGDKVSSDSKIKLDGRLIQTEKKRPVIIAFNKPAGIECTSDPRVSNNIIDAVDYPERVFHIGRLDKFSEGLILLTNIGEVVNRILRARFFHEKEYVVELNQPISDALIARLARGVELDDGKTRPCDVSRLATRRIKMVLTEGRNRQIRRMIDHIGLKVARLIRIRIINIRLGTLPKGHWRKLTDAEMKTLMRELDKGEASAQRRESPQSTPDLIDTHTDG